MKHTGLALVLAGQVLKDERRVILLIVLATLAQHIVAAALDWRQQRVGAPTSSDASHAKGLPSVPRRSSA